MRSETALAGLLGMAIMFLPIPSFAEGTQIEGFNLEGFDDAGQKSWEVNGDTADVQGNLIKLSNIIAHSYGENHYKVTARTGSVDQQKNIIHLKNDVVIRDDKGSRLLTDSLDWDRKADIITTDERVMIVDKTMMVTGTGMESKPGLKQTRVGEDVKFRVKPDESSVPQDTVIITSEGPMTIDQIGQTAVFEQNVVMTQNDQMVKADRVEMQFDGETKKITHVVCLGHVEIYQEKDTSYADRAVYDVQTQKMMLYGRPKMVIKTEGQDVFAPDANKPAVSDTLVTTKGHDVAAPVGN
ncbi:MAG: LPS export ABC transporter periplasmic protein LptC [Candidatus Omnitrophica bacterium CG12_big_fil_rev_8_21_14_0_65_50_5]|nr:MAG: LPS export ABC transporter periplasmic protein LptC [Candidatus Omnitrophica bacterium CG12_big_fil_rev_8_21_14_0_65_50_5]